jgi:Toprim domain/Zinc-binding domain of primase-helicase
VKPLPAHLVAKARGASFLAALERLDLRLKRVTATELSGPCPQCGGRDRFNVNTKKLAWFCRGCDAKGGDALSLIMHARGLDFGRAVTDLAGESADDARPGPAPIEAKLKPDAEDVARPAFIRRMAANAIARMRPIAGTDGEVYLREIRKINTGAIVDVLNSTAAIGWDPESFFREDGHRLDQQRLGAIIAIMTDPLTGAPTGGISRTFLHEGQKVSKAKGLGPAGIVRLTPDEEVLGGLHLAEGLETALAAMSKGLRPMWSTGSTSIMAKLPVVGGVEFLTIIADRDENGAGEKAAHEAGLRWREAGHEVRVWTPLERGDFNDLLMRGVL